MKTVIVKHDRSAVADLKRPFNTRHRKDSTASGSIELAYLRGLQAGREETLASVKAWMTATPFAICQMWGEYVTHMLSRLRR